MKSQPPAINEHIAAQFESARREFETWRQSRTGRSRIPETLWILAADLAKECGVFQTARELHLNYCALRNRMDSKGSRIVRSKPAVMGFVEVVPPPAAGFSECTVEIERRKGTKIRIHLKSGEAPDLGEICAAFLRARA
jgi:transcription antitermination factor NusG